MRVRRSRRAAAATQAGDFSPLLGTQRGDFEDVVREANDLALAGGFGERSQVVVITAGLQTNQSGKTNLIKAHLLD